MISALLRIILLVIIGYIIFSVISFAVRLLTGRVVPGGRQSPNEEPERRKFKTDSRGNKIIELDKDQYKVE